MTHQDKISLLITFAVGMVVGFYIYVSGFATTYRLPEVGTKQQYANMVITGESFGACEQDNSCLSFQLLQDGAYQGIIGGVEVEKEFKGKVSSRILRTIEKTLTTTSLESDIKPKPEMSCLYGDGETNFSFLVTLEGKNYRYDTCRTEFDVNGENWEVLKALWREVAATSVK